MKPHRRFRKFESELFSLPVHPECSMSCLRNFLQRVWLSYGCNKVCPTVVAGRGSVFGGGLSSYEQGGRIVLARQHRCKIVLLHEVAHYIANDPPPYHGQKFFAVYRELLFKYSNLDAMLIDNIAHACGLKIPKKIQRENPSPQRRERPKK